MNIEEAENTDLVGRILTGNAREDEMVAFKEWLNSSEANRREFEIYQKIWESGKIDKQYNLERAKARIHYKINHRRSFEQKVFNVFQKAAAILFLPLLIFSLYLYFNLEKPGDQELGAISQTIDCPVGNRSKVNLPDGTMVWLNSGSSITFPVSFSGEKKREISLSGEAYFNVMKDRKRPFLLSLGEITVRVSGTSFNVSNYHEDKQVEIMLESGRVELYTGSNLKSNDFTQLVPGQLATIEKESGKLSVNQANAERFVSWTKGFLVFDDDKMSEVIRKLQRWYNVEIEVLEQEINDYRFTATIKEETLEQFLELLKYTSPVEYQVENIHEDETMPVKQHIFLSTRQK